ncbi:hypothetical protein KKF55_04820 [Patescibacteria group bacterium]|nr:hypothetical protein [Patescibacteria group bacterium]
MCPEQFGNVMDHTPSSADERREVNQLGGNPVISTIGAAVCEILRHHELLDDGIEPDPEQQ